MTNASSAHAENGTPRDADQEIELNGAPHRIRGDCTVQALVDGLGLSAQALAVAVNREVLPRSAWRQRVLQPQDRVDLVRPIGGG